jgi:activator of HSP90 ATPase
MNEILTKVQVDLNKLQKTLEREGEVLIGKIKKAANKAATNKSVVEKKKEFEKLVDTQIKKLEPAFDKFYKELKVAAGKYGVNLDKLEKSVKTTTEKAASRLNIQPKSTKAKPKTQTSASASASEKSAGGGSAKKSGTGSRKKKASKKA